MAPREPCSIASSRGWRSITATISPRRMAEIGSPSTGRAENFCVTAGSRSTPDGRGHCLAYNPCHVNRRQRDRRALADPGGDRGPAIRHRSMAALKRSLAREASGCVGLGEPGIGKSRLVGKLSQRIDGTNERSTRTRRDCVERPFRKVCARPAGRAHGYALSALSLQMLGKVLVHLKHGHLVLAKDLPELVVGQDLTAVLRVL
jgi:hypothetical protein